jgi:hypothetical protein
MQVLPSAYFPSLAYVRALLQDPQLVLDYKEHFVKQSIRTRAEILSANGVIQLNVPILHTAHKQTLEVLQIDYSKNWQAEHWRAIESAYANSPHFEHYTHDIRQLFDAQYVYLHELNSAILKWINNVNSAFWPLNFYSEIQLTMTHSTDQQRLWFFQTMANQSRRCTDQKE